MLRFDVRDPLNWTGFALGVALSLMVVALSSPRARHHLQTHQHPCHTPMNASRPGGSIPLMIPNPRSIQISKSNA